MNIKSMFILAIYLLFGLAIVSLCIKAVQMRIQTILGDIGKKLLRDLVEFLRQMGMLNKQNIPEEDIFLF
jgi:hypothetical protein